MKALVIIIGIFSYINSVAQDTPLNQLVKIKFPKGTEKLSHERLQSFLIDKKGFNQNRDWTPKGDTYKINKMVLQLNGTAIKSPEKLEDSKKKWDGTMSHHGRHSPYYTSEIKSINNYRVLIMHFEAQDYALYNFLCVNNLNTKVLNGTLEYDKSDTTNRDNGVYTLDKILKRMKFK